MSKLDNMPAEGLPPLTLQDEAALEAWLAQARLDPVPDEGFSAALMQRLPDPGRYRRRSRAPLWGAGLGGAVLAWQLASGLSGAGLPGRLLILACLLGLSALVSGWVWSEREG